MSTSNNQRVLVFGSTGVIGTALVKILSKDHPSWHILAVSRHNDGKSRLAKMELPNVTTVAGDPFNKTQVQELAAPCDMIYFCVGFHRYEAKYWAKHWPLAVENLLSTVDEKNKKRIIFCDNIYAYGTPDETVSIRTTPVPASHRTKPGIRAGIRATFAAHMVNHPGTLTVIGAADFFGPHVTTNSFLGDTMTGKIVVENASPLAVGSCSVVHDFCYAPDFARAMAVASVRDEAYDRFWIAPHSVHGKTMQEIGNEIATLAERPSPVKFKVLGKPMVYMLSPFMSFMWEMIEMLPFWTKDYKVDDSDFCKTFDVEATPSDEALKFLVEFFLEKKKTEGASRGSDGESQSDVLFAAGKRAGKHCAGVAGPDNQP
jgi:nucleoside-diphosphate-sugar epimerase